MKHPQHILTVDKDRFGVVGLGPLVRMPPKAFFESVYASLFIGRRHELETDERFAQLLPYVVLRRTRADGLVDLFEYQRTNQIGESRLGGKKSVGTGGHVDLCDVRIDDNSVIDVVATVALALAREMNEEIGFKLKIGDEFFAFTYDQLRQGVTWAGDSDVGISIAPQPMTPKFVGVINDQSDAVGRVHMGCVFVIDVPEGFYPYCREPELITIGMRPAVDIVRDDLENWSKLIVEDPEFIA